jgi:DNA integrity scanning protein DisA with diadenylate cyclase activity
MSMSKNHKEIQAEIKALEACKSYIPPETIFGDNNIRTVDLQIECLRGEIDTTAQEFEEDYNDDEKSNIQRAQDWVDGFVAESPSSEWDDFKPKGKAKKK